MSAARPRWRRAAIGALAIALGVLGWWAWISAPLRLRDRLFPRRFVVVEEAGLFRSGQISGGLIEGVLTDHRIDLIVDLTVHGPDRPDQDAELAAAKALGIEQQNFPLNGDGTGRPEEFAAAVAAVARARAAGRRVLVHCAAGDRRTGAVLFLYAALVKREPLDVAREELDRFDHRAADDDAASRFLDSCMGEIASGLVALGAIAEVPAPLPRAAVDGR